MISASWYGKFKTVFQMIAIVLFTIKDSYMMGTLVEAFSDVMWVISWIVMAIASAAHGGVDARLHLERPAS